MTESIAILGGGPAGVGTAYYANRFGLAFKLFEKSASAGGICQTHSYEGHRFDAGAHRFHDRDRQITEDLFELLGDRLVPVYKPSKVLISGRFIDFPPTPIDMLFSAGIPQVGRIGLDFLKGRFHRGDLVSFADFAVKHFGKTLAKRFLLNYSEKVWGLPAEQLSPAIATRRLSGMNLKTLIIELVKSSKKTEHLDGQFLYPRGGYGRIVEALVESLPSEDLHFNHHVSGFRMADDYIREILFADGRSCEVPGDVVSTLPLTLSVRLLGEHLDGTTLDAASKLRFRHIRLIFLRIDREQVSENASIYIPDPELVISRIYEPRNRCITMSPPGETAIVAECPCFEDDQVGQMADQELCSKVVEQLAGLGVIERDSIKGWTHHFLHNAYPVYCLAYEENVRKVLTGLQRIQNLDLLGRNGLFYYSHLHDQLRSARDYVALRVTRSYGCAGKRQMA